MAYVTDAIIAQHRAEDQALRAASPFQVWIYLEKLDSGETLPYLHTKHIRFKTLDGALKRARIEARNMFSKLHPTLNGRIEVYAVVEKSGLGVHRELMGAYYN